MYGLSPYHTIKISYALCKHGICAFYCMALLNAYAHYTISPYKKKLNFLSAVMTGLYFCGTIASSVKNRIFHTRDLCLRALDTNSRCAKSMRRNGD